MVNAIIILVISVFLLGCTKNENKIASDKVDLKDTIINNETSIPIYSMVESNELLNQIVNNGYINELEKLITVEQLTLFSESDLRILRNTIYAKYGYKFNSIDLQNHFSEFQWYNSEFENVDDKFTFVDIENIKLIQKSEKSINEIKDILIGNWYFYGGIANEGMDSVDLLVKEGDHLQIMPNGTYIFTCKRHVLTEEKYYGLWQYKNNVFETIPSGEHSGHDEKFHPTYRKVDNFRIEYFTFNNGSIHPTSALFNHGYWAKE